MTVLSPSLPPYRVRITRMPSPSLKVRSSDGNGRSDNPQPVTAVSNPAAPTPAVVNRNRRRFTSIIFETHSCGEIFGRIHRGGEQLRWALHESSKRGCRSVRPRTDADHVAGGVDAVALRGVLDHRYVAALREFAC